MPNELITAAEIRNDHASALYGVSKEIKLTRITPYVIAASVRLRSWVGDAAYDDALDVPSIAALPVAEQRQITQRRAILKAAEGDLTMSYLVANLNSAIRPQGLLAETKVEGQTTERYFTPEQTQARAREFFEQAVILVEPYRVTEIDAEIFAESD